MSREEPFLPFARPSVGEEEIAAVLETLRSGWLTAGPRCREFEERFAEFVGAAHAVAVNSATAALHLALEARGIGPGDKVLTTPYTFTSTAEVARYLGAEIVLADVCDETLNLSSETAAEVLAREPGVRAIVPVHFAGLACDMAALAGLAAGSDAAVVEDAAHALPATHDGRMIGSVGDATAFSFYATKTLATGEGGMLTTDDGELAERARVMRLHGISRDVFDRYTSTKPSWYYEVIAPGYKYNMTDVAAALGLVQLERAESMRQRREELAARYNRALSDLPLRLPESAPPGETHAWHLYVIRLELERLRIDRETFIERMTEAGIGTSVHFIPLHVQPYWAERYGLHAQDYPVAFEAYRRAVSLPLYPAMTDADAERVIAAVRGVLESAAA